MLTRIIAAVSLVAVLSPAIAGAGHAGDVQIAADAGRLVTGSLVGDIFIPERVYAAELGEIVPNLTDEPGFEAASGALTPNTSVGFRIMDALRVWNGADFATVSDSTMTLSFLTLSATTPDAPGDVVDGERKSVDASGGVHNHPFYQLNAPADAGVYLLELRLNGAGLAESESFYIVFNQNSSEASHDAALDHAREFIVPAPGIGGLALLGGVCSLRRRR